MRPTLIRLYWIGVAGNLLALAILVRGILGHESDSGDGPTDPLVERDAE